MVRFNSVTTASESFAVQVATDEPSLFSLAKKCGTRKPVIEMLILHFASINKFLKQGTPLDNEEMLFIAEEVYREYKLFFTFADIAVVMRNAKMGKYGRLYNRLSASDVIEWFTKYQISKDEAVAAYRTKESEQFAKMPITLPYKWENGKIVLKETKESDTKETPKQSDKDKEYTRIKRWCQYQAILIKPSEERTENEANFLADYERMYNQQPK